MNYETKDSMASADVAYEVDGQMITREQFEAVMAQKRQELAGAFVKQRDAWVKYRASSGVENRWRVSQALYLGEDSEVVDSALTDTLKNGPKMRNKAQAAPRSKVTINIVRPKVDQAVARMCEILLPVDDRNWGISATPVPDLVNGMVGSQAPTMDAQSGQLTGRTADQEAQIVIASARKCAELMETEIDDSLNECNYNSEQRRAIEDGVRLGTACMIGPYPKGSAKRKWVKTQAGMQLSFGDEANCAKAASMRADPWDVWTDPACGNDHQRGQGFYHRRYVTRKEIRALEGVPGYDKAAITEVLRNKPNRLTVAEGRVMRQSCEEDSYEMWVYYGQVEPDEMELLSCGMEGDPLVNVQDGVIMMIGDAVIGAIESWVPDGSLPLDIWCWRKADDSPYGYSLPIEMLHQQRVVIASWRQVMDDAKFSVGGQLVIKKAQLRPQDGSYTLYPGKVWLADEEAGDVRNAMAMIEFTNHSEALLKIATSAMQFSDMETSMPQLLGGEKGDKSTAPETLGGMVMLYNNANTVLRLRVKLYDDSLTRPHISRHYDYQMQNSPKDEIKGDMVIDARGSTALLQKDIQHQNTLNLAVITSNPRYNKFLDPKRELMVIVRAMQINPEDIMLTDSEIKQAEQAAQQTPPPQDPRIEAANITAQTKQAELADRKEQRQADTVLAQEDAQIKREGITYTAERERADGEQAMAKLQVDRELAIAQMAQDGQESELERQSKERLQAVNLDVKTQLFSAEAAIKVKQGSGI